MTTNADVIQDAFNLIGVTDGINLSAEDGALGLRAMNDLLSMWDDNEVDISYSPQTSLTDTTPIAAEHMMAVKYNLAVAAAPYFGKTPSAVLLGFASASYNNLLRQNQNSRIEAVDTLHAPLGSGYLPAWNIITDS